MNPQIAPAKYNKSQIFRNAWTIVRTGKSLSQALTLAWAEAKSPKNVLSAIATELVKAGLEINYAVSVASQLDKIYDADYTLWINYGKVRAYVNFSGTNKGKKTYIDLISGVVTSDHARTLVCNAFRNTNFNY